MAGRECRLITIEPVDKLRYGYRLCSDVETNLLLKAQTLNAARGVVEQVSFTSLRLGSEVDPQSLASRWNTRDWKVLEPSMKQVDLAAQGWCIPAPEGFTVIMQVARSMGRSGTVSQVVLSDGLAAISVFIEPYDSLRGHTPPHGAAQRGSITVYGTRIADFWLTAVGEVPLTTLEQLAQGTEYVPAAARHGQAVISEQSMKTMLGSNLQFRRLLAAMVAGLLMSTAYAPASLAQTPTVALPDFTTIVEKADPAVVNIRTTATVPVRGPGMGGGNDPMNCSAGSSDRISSRRASNRPRRGSVRSLRSLKSAPCRAAWDRASSSPKTATSSPITTWLSTRPTSTSR